MRLEALMNPATQPPAPVAPPLDRRPLTRKLACVQTGLNHIDEAITPTDAPVERAPLSQYQEEVSDYKGIATLYEELTTKNVADDNELLVTHSALERQLSSTPYKIKSLLVVPHTDTPTPATTDGTWS